MNINEYFDKIYCLNLSRRTDRWETVKKRFDAAGLNVTRWEGLDGGILEMFLEGNPKKRNYIACTMSHLMMINHAKCNNYERVLILEDDVCPHKDIHKLFDDFYEKQSKLTWDIFYFGFTPVTDDGKSWSYKLLDGWEVDKNITRARRHISGAWAYCLQKKFIAQLYETITKQHVSPHQVLGVDPWLQKNYLESSITAFAYVPQLFGHDNGYSDNTMNSFDRLTRSIEARLAKVEDYIV